LVCTGAYAYTGNPMYLGGIFIFLAGLTLTLESGLAALITAAVAVWSHMPVLGDEKKFLQVIGTPYENYLKRVKRWIPGIF
jgi:protein-S-isoprenylcysteine O-methyltransferase Ste14